MTEASALEDLYRSQGPAIWRALLAFTGDRDVADDTLSEAFTQALARGTRSGIRCDGYGASRSASREGS